MTARTSKRGRPPLTEEEAQRKAARIVEVAWALRFAPSRLKGMGLTGAQARALVFKRYRGRVGELIGSDLDWVNPHHSRHRQAAHTAAELIDGGMTRPAALRAAIRWHEGNTGRVPGEIDRVVTLDERTVRRLLADIRPITRK